MIFVLYLACLLSEHLEGWVVFQEKAECEIITLNILKL